MNDRSFWFGTYHGKQENTHMIISRVIVLLVELSFAFGKYKEFKELGKRPVRNKGKIREILYDNRDMFSAVDISRRTVDGRPVQSPTYLPGMDPWTLTNATLHTITNTLNQRHACSTVLEVGAWSGSSTIRLASSLSKCSTVVALDTWLGSLEFYENEHTFWSMMSFITDLGIHNALNQFIYNVKHADMQNRIVPFPQSTITGAKILWKKGIRFDAIYIDAGHEYEEVLRDLNLFWELLLPGGILFGDDYSAWPGVKKAVNEFARVHGLKVTLQPSVSMWSQPPSGTPSRDKTEYILSPKSIRRSIGVQP